MKRALPLLLALAAAIPAGAGAQGLEVFEIETFVDPNSLWIPLENGGRQDFSFVAAYYRFGYANDYQYRSRFTESGVPFSDLTATYVRGRNQLTGRWIELGDMPGGDGRRFEARLGRYWTETDSGTTGDVAETDEEEAEDEEETPPVLSRLEGSVAVQDGTGIWDGTAFGVRAEMSAVRSLDVVAGVSYSYFRPEGTLSRFQRDRGPSPATHFASLDFRTNIWVPGQSFSLDHGGGIGANHDAAGTHWGSLRGEVRLKWRPQSDRWRWYAVYAPAYQLQRSPGQQRGNQEISVFAHVRVLTKLLPRGRSEG